MRRTIASVLIISMLTMIWGPAAYAQEIGGAGKDKTSDTTEELTPPTLGEDATWMTCDMRGKSDGRKQSTGGSTVGGLFGGLLLGLIGTGIAVLAQTKSDPPADYMLQLDGQSDECKYAYIEAFRDANHSKKKSSALTGGLIGTVVIVSIILATSGE